MTDADHAALGAALERGNWPLARLLARRAIEARPDLAFEDLGFAAAFARHGRRFAGYRERVETVFARRWGIGRAPRRHDHDCGAIVAADASNEAWMCCDRWTRKFNRKPNMRAFAERNGVAVPRLYHQGAEVDAVPFGSLPLSAVFKVDPGHATREVLAVRNGTELRSARKMERSAIADFLRERMDRVRRHRPLVLVEEYLCDEDPRRTHPLDYRFYVFGGRVAAMVVASRNPHPLPLFDREWYSRNFVAAPRPLLDRPGGRLAVTPPSCLDAMVAQAERLGALVGEPSRIDMYATDRGAVLGEITVNPYGGAGFTPYGDLVLAQAWEIFAGSDVAPRPAFPDDVPAGDIARELAVRARRRVRNLLGSRPGAATA